MKIARSTFYRRRKTRNPDRMKSEADLIDRIETICLEFPRYGYRRVTEQLKRERLAGKPQEGTAADAGERFTLPGQAPLDKDHR